MAYAQKPCHYHGRLVCWLELVEINLGLQPKQKKQTVDDLEDILQAKYKNSKGQQNKPSTALMSCRCTLMHALQHTSGLHMIAQFMYLLAYQEWGVMSDEQSGGRAFLMFFRFSRAAGRRETCTSWAPGDSSPVEGKSCAGLRSVSLRWPTKRHEKDTKKDQIRTKQIKKRRMCFLSISLSVLIFCWRKRVFGWIFICWNTSRRGPWDAVHFLIALTSDCFRLCTWELNAKHGISPWMIKQLGITGSRDHSSLVQASLYKFVTSHLPVHNKDSIQSSFQKT